MSSYFSLSKQIPLYPPFSKGEFTEEGRFLLFEKEGQGEILDKSDDGH